MKDTYIPKDLNDCFIELNDFLELKYIEEIKNKEEDNVKSYHHGLGRKLRNEWELWSGSCLAKWFKRQGIFHPDDMSGIIILSFWRHLNYKPIKLDEQIKYYQDYWKERNVNKVK